MFKYQSKASSLELHLIKFGLCETLAVASKSSVWDKVHRAKLVQDKSIVCMEVECVDNISIGTIFGPLSPSQPLVRGLSVSLSYLFI